MNLPIFLSQVKDIMLMQTKWASILNPVLSNPSIQSIIIPNVTLAIGSNSINHRLGRKLVGWRMVRKRAAAEIYDTQDSNQTPDLTLVLVSNAVSSIDLEVF